MGETRNESKPVNRSFDERRAQKQADDQALAARVMERAAGNAPEKSGNNLSFAQRREDKAVAAMRKYLSDPGSVVTVGMFRQLFDTYFPDVLRGLVDPTSNGSGDTPPSTAATLVAMWVAEKNQALWMEAAAGSGLAVYGTPKLYKGIFLRGWSKSGSTSEWVPMTVTQEAANEPTRLATDFVDGTDAYPWYGLRWTYDYQRMHDAGNE
jgi:hypothetical protein